MDHVDWRRWLLCVCSALACGPKAGSVESDTAADTSGGSDGADATSDSGGTDVGIVGTWSGYVDAGAALPSRSDRVELHITAVELGGQITGTVSFGEPGMLPRATDPDVGYPDAYEGQPSNALFEKVAYTLTGTYQDGTSRLQAELQVAQVWSDWCALQTSYPISRDGYGCVPNCGYSGGDGGCSIPDDCPFLPGPIDCVKLELCNDRIACDCDAAGCSSRPSPLPLDLHRDGDELQGPIEGSGNAFLTRQ